MKTEEWTKWRVGAGVEREGTGRGEESKYEKEHGIAGKLRLDVIRVDISAVPVSAVTQGEGTEGKDVKSST